MKTQETSFSVRVTCPSRPVAGKLADAELAFVSGPLAGHVLEGFSIWEHPGKARTVTFPSRPYSVKGESRRHVLLRATDARELTALILKAYEESRT